MKALRDVSLWMVVQLRTLWCVVRVLLETLVMWLLCHIPSMKVRLLASHNRLMQSSNWQVRAVAVGLDWLQCVSAI